MSDLQYAFIVTATDENPCHLSEVKKGDVFYLVRGSQKSELLRATENAIAVVEDGKPVWSIAHEIYQ